MNTTQHNLIVALSLCATFAVPSIATAVSISSQGTWESTLLARDLDGNLATTEAYYDTVLGVTWLADANLAASNTFGLTRSGNINPSAGQIGLGGKMDWFTAEAWVNAMNQVSFFGYGGWRLPSTFATVCDTYYLNRTCGYNVLTSSSEMAYMFHEQLGNLSIGNVYGTGPQEGGGLTNTGPFSNIQSAFYWSGTEHTSTPGYAWVFDFGGGSQARSLETNASFYGWAVHDGDIGVAIPSAVPIPAAAWLFSSGLLGLVGVARRKSMA